MKASRLATGALVLAACGGAPPAAAPATSDPVSVAVIHLAPASDSGRYRAAGTVRALRRAELATRMMARIEAVRVRAGDRVRQGQVLATFEKSAVTAAATQAGAGLELATSNLRRMERLHADSAIPLAQLEAARAGYDVARGRADAAGAELGYTSLTAPFDGVVAARNADPGDLASPGQPLLVIEDLGAREIAVGVPDAVAMGIRVGQRIPVRIGTASSPVTAAVTAVVPSADPVSRTVEIRLSAGPGLTPGVTATAEFPAPATIEELVIPTGAIVTRGELTGVYLVTTDSVARLRWIRLGRVADGRAAIAAGLMAGDAVIADPAGVRDGARIRPRPGTERVR